MSGPYLPDVDGKEAEVGKSVGYWLTADDFVSTSDTASMQDFGAIGFLRDWPDVYSSSKELKSLIGKKGKCPGKKVSVVPTPTPEDLEQVNGVALHKLQSFLNAERVAKKTGMRVLRGWAVFEHLDKPVSAAFVAERYWWNETADGRWVDFTPRPDSWPELLLAEAKEEEQIRTMATLTAEQSELGHFLLSRRFNLKRAENATTSGSTSSSVLTQAACSASTAVPIPGPLGELVSRVVALEPKAMRELEEKIKNDEQLSVQVVEHLRLPLVAGLRDRPDRREETLDLMLALTDAGVEQRCSTVNSDFIQADAVPALVALLNKPDTLSIQDRVSAVLGNLCHESHDAQSILAAAGALPPLVALLGAEDQTAAQEAAYAIWNLTVGNERTSAEVVKQGAVPKLVKLLKSSSEMAQENAAGALMHVTVCEDAKSQLVETQAISRFCELLQTSPEAEVKTQVAGALLNLASDSAEHARLIAKSGAVGPLVELVREGTDTSRDYSAGALINLMRNDSETTCQVFKEGAVAPLVNMLSQSHGHSEALGALANLASGSSERQAAIYKAQVTRRSVSLLQAKDPDVRRSAAALLMNLASHPKIKERIVEAGALKPLASNLQDEDSVVRERSVGALANLFNDHSKNTLAGFKQIPGMIHDLVAILNRSTESAASKRQAAHTLAMLAAEDAPCQDVLAAGAGQPLVAMLDEHIGEAALGIMNLAWNHPDVKAELAAVGAVEKLSSLLQVGNDLAKEYAAGALMNMTAGSIDNAKKATSSIPHVAEVLKSDSLHAVEWSAGALANIMKAGPAAQDAAIAAGASVSLAEALLKATVGGRSLVVLALSQVAERAVGSADVRKALGSKQKAKLKEFRDGGSDDLKENVATLIQRLGNDFVL